MGVLVEIVKDLFSKNSAAPRPTQIETSRRADVSCVLNVGGGSKATPIPDFYSDWRHDLLDIDPRGEPDIVCDARLLSTLQGAQYDAVYCSHNLEHYYRHEGLDVVKGFFHILKETGFAEIRVPDIAQVINALLEKQLDLDDVLYHSAAGPISAHDVIYGLQSEIIQSGQDFYAHKTGFTSNSLIDILKAGGFTRVYLVNDEHLGLHAFAFKSEPSSDQIQTIGNSLGTEFA